MTTKYQIPWVAGRLPSWRSCAFTSAYRLRRRRRLCRRGYILRHLRLCDHLSLLGDLGADKFSILAFYERRVRRIFPALIFHVHHVLAGGLAAVRTSWTSPTAFSPNRSPAPASPTRVSCR